MTYSLAYLITTGKGMTMDVFIHNTLAQPTVTVSADRHDDPQTITELDVADENPLGPWVECEEYSTHCTGGGRTADMVKLPDGWMCHTCFGEAQGDAEDYERTARGW